jgi:hypothetical protein
MNRSSVRREQKGRRKKGKAKDAPKTKGLESNALFFSRLILLLLFLHPSPQPPVVDGPLEKNKRRKKKRVNGFTTR